MKRSGSLVVGLPLVFALACGTDAERVKRSYLEKGNKHFEAGQYAEAVINYRKAITKDAKYAEAHYRLGLAETKRSRLPQAFRALNQALDLDPSNLDAKIKLADLTLSAYILDPQRSPVLREQIVTLAGELSAPSASPFDSFRLRGQLALLDGRQQDALESLTKAADLRPLHPEVSLALAQCFLREKTSQERGEELALRLIQKEKTFGPIYDALYVYYMNEKRWADAESLLRSKASNNPASSDFAFDLATHLFRTGKHAETNAVLARLLSDSKSFPNARLLVGDFYRSLGMPDQALRLYQEGERTDDPASRNVYRRRLASLLLGQGKTAEAATLIDSVLKELPKDEEGLVIRARIRMAANRAEDIEAAITDLKSLVTNTPDNLELRMDLGKAYQAKREFDAARAQFQEAVRRRKDYTPARLALAELSLTLRDYKGALRSADEALAVSPDDLPAQILRAAALSGSNKTEMARLELHRILKRYPQSRPAELQLAMVDLAERKYKDAELIFRKHYQPGQRDLRPLDGLVELLMAQDRSQQALELLQNELRTSPAPEPVRLRLARVAVRSLNFDLALTHYRELLAADPQSPSLHFDTGEVQRLRGDWVSAAASYQRATELAPRDATVLNRLGAAFEMTGRQREAMAQYRKVLALQPDDPFALNNLAFLMAEMGGDLDEALRFAQRAQRAWPDNPKVSDTIGWIYLKRNNHQSAQQIFSSLVQRHPNEPSFRYHLGVVLLETGNKAAAKTELQNALSQNPSKEDEDKIRRLIAQIG